MTLAVDSSRRLTLPLPDIDSPVFSPWNVLQASKLINMGQFQSKDRV